MKKFQFVAESKWNKPEQVWYFTKIDDCFVSNSGSFEKEVAYEKFMLLVNGGSLEDKVEILEELITEPKS